jgi:hypothetical protein
MANLDEIFKEKATPDGEVSVDISYDLIRQFSAQLYTNPRKAIEELVCNGYDAGATECHVKLPSNKTDALVVLDNGESMDLEGLQNLWLVAKSPKQPGANGLRVDHNRLQIGKFGVGKLAAYALGRRLTHVATMNGISRLVSVGEDEIKDRTGGGPPRFKVYRMKERDARSLLEPFLGNLPRPWQRHWTRWTMAAVEEVEEANFEQALKIGILRRMITAALPIFKDFKVVLEGKVVPGRGVIKDPEVTVDVQDSEFRRKLELDLREYWSKKRDIDRLEDVSPELYTVKLVKMADPHDLTKKIPAIQVPQLGPLAGRAILAKQNLTTEKLDERGYLNHGFAIYAHGKLINPEDELFGITQRSHAYWRRFLGRVEIPDLDDVLLVQRNAVSENSVKAQVAREVMRTLFNFTRSLAEKKEESKEFAPKSFGAKIRTGSPLLGPLAFEGLGQGELPEGGISSVDIEFVTMGEDGPAARYDPEEHVIQVNEDHPIIAALDDLGPQRQKQWRRVMGEVVAGSKLAEGFLTARNVEEDIIKQTEELIDVSLRNAASYIRDPVEEHIQEIEEASYEGGTRFENAVANAFRSLGLAAQRIGGSDNPDGTIDIPVTGKKNLRICIEAKGRKGIVSHKDLSESSVARHKREKECTSAIAVAREYQVQGKGGKSSALIREAKAGKLPLLMVSAIEKMLRLHQRRPFTYDKVAKVLTKWKPPNKVNDFIETTWRELPELGLLKLVLEVAHDKSTEHDRNYPDPGMLCGDSRLAKRNIDKPQVEHILEAVAITTGMIVIKDRKRYEFELKGQVETILDAMTRASEEDLSTPLTESSTVTTDRTAAAKKRN